MAVVGKYTKLHDSYKSIQEALTHAGTACGASVDIEWVESDLLAGRGVGETLGGAMGILIPGGFGMRGIEGKILAAEYARKNSLPFFGICAGMQCAVIEFARNECGLEGANSIEFDPETPYPVIDFLPGQIGIKKKGATMRLGSFPCSLKKGTAAYRAYKAEMINERHRHRYEFNMAFADRFENAGMIMCGTSPDGKLLEVLEIPGHPFYIACQFHPEFKSKFGEPHPLFREFIKQSLKAAG